MTDLYKNDIDIIEERLEEYDKSAKEHRQLAEWLKDYKRLQTAIEDIKVEIKGWYWDADKQKLAKDPCVVDAMVDLFIRTIDKHINRKNEANGI